MDLPRLRPVPGLPTYHVSRCGRVFTDHGGALRELRQRPNDGYPHVQLAVKRCGLTSSSVHRMVALAWVENPEPERFNVVRHRDDDRSNPNADNLVWGTQRMNVDDALERGRYPRGEAKVAAIMRGKLRRGALSAEAAARWRERLG